MNSCRHSSILPAVLLAFSAIPQGYRMNRYIFTPSLPSARGHSRVVSAVGVFITPAMSGVCDSQHFIAVALKFVVDVSDINAMGLV